MNEDNYKNFILKALLENGGEMHCRDVIAKFKDEFLYGGRKIYLQPDELDALNNEDLLFDTISWARAGLKVGGFLQSWNPVGMWELTDMGIQAAHQLSQDEATLYLDANMHYQLKETLKKITDPEAKKQFMDAFLYPG